MEGVARDKHSSLLRKFVNCGRKKYYNIDQRQRQLDSNPWNSGKCVDCSTPVPQRMKLCKKSLTWVVSTPFGQKTFFRPTFCRPSVLSTWLWSRHFVDKPSYRRQDVIRGNGVRPNDMEPNFLYHTLHFLNFWGLYYKTFYGRNWNLRRVKSGKFRPCLIFVG
jgi:hypothetical protein